MVVGNINLGFNFNSEHARRMNSREDSLSKITYPYLPTHRHVAED